MVKNIFYCSRFDRFFFQKMIDGKLYKKMFRTEYEAIKYRDYFYITYYNGVNVQAKIDKDLLF